MNGGLLADIAINKGINFKIAPGRKKSNTSQQATTYWG